jgi:hypothetical protein
LRARIAEITGDVEPVLEEPDSRTSKRQCLPLAPETHQQDGGESQLPDCAAIGLQSLAEDSHNGVSRFVKQQVGVVHDQDKPRLGYCQQ